MPKYLLTYGISVPTVLLRDEYLATCVARYRKIVQARVKAPARGPAPVPLWPRAEAARDRVLDAICHAAGVLLERCRCDQDHGELT